MKRIILMRHGDAQPEHLSKVDRDRPLSGMGLKQIDGMCQKMHTKLQGVDLVLCSNARRARQTYDGIRKILPATATVEFEDRLYHAPSRFIMDRLHRLDERFQNVLFIGHNPGFQDFLNITTEKNTRNMLVKSFHPSSAAFFEMRENFWFNVDYARLHLVDQILP
jgi:phosphohistidine phosphatase